MKEILVFLIDHCSYLWAQGRYRFVDSGVASGNLGGGAYVTLERDALRMRFVNDRGQLFLDLQESGASGIYDWYSIDLIRRLLTGERQDSSIFGEEYARFLQAKLSDIELLFSNQATLPETKRQLRDLKKRRAKEMFG